ncbi:unnamed protein product [Nippostrongylus brasiliensis]|uniref:Tyrosine 3-monooxygenase (inferred by orthology to a C. elegans protein) n=1 Tax=Nippostrongylus brasiliensis TaxID=27835 RepID=A0A158R3G9_NIPBR|nr:unnamed protein product [Nippostrongylus brasiliensis]
MIRHVSEVVKASPYLTSEKQFADPLLEKRTANATSSDTNQPRRYSLAHQASCETILHADLKRQSTLKHLDQLKEITRGQQRTYARLTPTGVKPGRPRPGHIPAAGYVYLGREVNMAKDLSPELGRRKRTVCDASNKWDLLADCEGTKGQVIAAASDLTQKFQQLTEIALYRRNGSSEVPWFPRHISELDKCSHCITKYEPTTDPRHPGYGDQAYIARRKFLNDQAMTYKHGDPIPYVHYTKEEQETWRAVYEKLKALHETHTCLAYRRNLKLLEDEGVISPKEIPQISEVNKYLQSGSD